MIPITLKIKGLYSYQDQVTVDFTKLTESHIFGIFGSVGSGKSSILEAISFALFGETERLNKTDRRGYNMMNLKSSELFIDFIFQNSSQLYRFTVTAKRNSKKFTDIRTFDRKAYKQNPDQTWEPISAVSAEEIIGLSYENFRRTIIIPQGKFQDFIELGDKERTEMMKEIFNLHKYELSDSTRQLETANTEKIQLLQGKLHQLGDIDPEELACKIKEHQALSQQIIKLKLDLEKSEANKAQFDTLISKKKDEQNRLKALQESHAKTLDSVEISTKILQKQELEFQQLKKDYNQKDQLKEKINDLKIIIRIRQGIESQKANSESLAKGQKIVADSEKQIAETKKLLELTKSKTEAQKKLLPNVSILTALKQWHALNSTYQTQLKTHLAEVEKLIPQELTDKFKALSKIADQISLLSKQQASIDQDLKKSRQQRDESKLQNQLVQYAQALKPGDCCPLCGSDEHPNIKSSTELTQQLSSLEQEIKTAEDLNKSIDSAIKLLAIAQADEATLSVHQKTFQWTEHKSLTKTQVDQKFQDFEANQKKLDDLAAEQESLQKKLDQENADLQRYHHRIQQLIQSQAVAQAESQTLKDQLKQCTFDDFAATSISDLTTQSTELNQKLENLEKLYQSAEKQVQELHKQIEKLKGESEGQQKNIALCQKTLITTEESITNKFKSIQAENSDPALEFTDYFTGLLTKITESKNNLTFHNQSLGKLEKEITTIEKALADHATTAKELAKLQSRAENITTLKNLFKGSGFVNYVSSVYLQNLCSAANERFQRLTRQSLQLEVADDNSFQIRDFLNNGEIRSIKTLSGGQTFQAALSLALALADSVQKISQSEQSFFFLDEGFGSLDQDESLQIVFDTLKSLRSENKTVGIISHLEKLKQEIDVYLEVSNDLEQGSIVKQSWS